MRAERLDGIVRLHAAGELDMATTPQLDEALTAIEKREPAVIILDIRDLTFMDSTGLHAMLRAHRRAAENDRLLAVVNGSNGVRRVFEITATDHLLESQLPSDMVGASLQEGWLPLDFPGANGG